MFEPINFQNLNETDIREEILAPLIRRLGYRSDTEHNVVREQSLRYPRIFIGRKNSKKDPILRGSADYILDAGSAVRWVIEAKAPDIEINLETIEQAYTYANHPEVRAVYFSLSNGKRLVVFQTNRGPDAEPILDLFYEAFEEKYHMISNLLSPESILHNNPDIKPDLGVPIGEGLRSVVRVTNGVISYHGSSVHIPALKEMIISISGGAIERDEEGHLVAFLNTVAPTRSMQNLNQRLGLTSFEMYCNEGNISNNPSAPTVFRGNQIITLSAGEQLLDINSWQQVTLPTNVTCKVITEASGYLKQNLFYGDFVSIMDFIDWNQKIRLDGKYEIFLA
ncbi:MAG: type I restriction enzyme HsdR N-terminal domain-containing protein [Desulfobacteraceae bacterium]|nr:type I restriction enzyme HsdR N-terminal domain-containing protein [Desulfobacteraceae bacterium]